MADLRLSQPPKFQHIFTSQFNPGPFLQQNQYTYTYKAIGPPMLSATPNPLMSVPPPCIAYNSPPHQSQDKQNYQYEQNSTYPFADMYIGFFDRK